MRSGISYPTTLPHRLVQTQSPAIGLHTGAASSSNSLSSYSSASRCRKQTSRSFLSFGRQMLSGMAVTLRLKIMRRCFVLSTPLGMAMLRGNVSRLGTPAPAPKEWFPPGWMRFMRSGFAIHASLRGTCWRTPISPVCLTLPRIVSSRREENAVLAT